MNTEEKPTIKTRKPRRTRKPREKTDTRYLTIEKAERFALAFFIVSLSQCLIALTCLLVFAFL